MSEGKVISTINYDQHAIIRDIQKLNFKNNYNGRI